MSEETIVAIFDTAAHAEAAISDMKAANVPSGAISQHAGTTGAAQGSTAQPAREPGFWGSLFGGQPDHDTAVYDRSMEAGSVVVTVRAPAEHVDGVLAILERHTPVDIEARAASYGLGAGSAATATSTAQAPASAGTVSPVAPVAGEEVIALSEEQIAVGKRLVDRGTTRIRRFVVETPVEEQVRLHSERVSIERRPVAGGTPVADTAFQDKVIEVAESDEEAVVGKTARVREEVVIQKEAVDRVETIHDTVRREDVEIVKEGGTQTTGTATTGRPKI